MITRFYPQTPPLYYVFSLSETGRPAPMFEMNPFNDVLVQYGGMLFAWDPNVLSTLPPSEVKEITRMCY